MDVVNGHGRETGQVGGDGERRGRHGGPLLEVGDASSRKKVQCSEGQLAKQSGVMVCSDERSMDGDVELLGPSNFSSSPVWLVAVLRVVGVVGEVTHVNTPSLG